MDEVTPRTPIKHRHADGTEHTHPGREGFEIGGQVVEDHYGDQEHTHGSLSLGGGDSKKNVTGSVVWSERDTEDRP